MSSSDTDRIKELEAEILRLKRKIYSQAKELKRFNARERNAKELESQLFARSQPYYVFNRAQELLRLYDVSVIHCACPTPGEKPDAEELKKRWCLFTESGLDAEDCDSLHAAWQALNTKTITQKMNAWSVGK